MPDLDHNRQRQTKACAGNIEESMNMIRESTYMGGTIGTLLTNFNEHKQVQL